MRKRNLKKGKTGKGEMVKKKIMEKGSNQKSLGTGKKKWEIWKQGIWAKGKFGNRKEKRKILKKRKRGKEN